MVVIAEIHMLENAYHPYIVLNQWISNDIIQSHAEVDEVTAKNTKKMAPLLVIARINQRYLPGCLSP